MHAPHTRASLTAVLLGLTLALLGPVESRAGPADARHGAGITVLASGIGHDYEVEDLLAFVTEARIRDVIVDWAWITLHWDRTDFEKVDEFVAALERRDVRVAAMYRPRFKPHEIERYPVAYQIDAEGQPLAGYCQIRYADAEARAWGTSWAVEILKRCPAFDEVVIYNPSQHCQSSEVRAARETDPDHDSTSVRTFLAETRAAIRKVKRKARLGLVLPPAKALYDRYAGAVDVVRPFVFVREDADYETDWDHAQEVMEAAEAPGPALAKITWGPEEKVSDERLAAFIRSARAREQRFVFWTFWTTFCEGHYDLDVLCEALGLEAKRIRPLIRDLGGASGLPWDPVVVRQAVRKAADDLTEDAYLRMLEAADRFGEDAVEPLCRLLDDRKESDHTRWRAAGALGRIGSPAALPSLLRSSEDPSHYVRWLCAEALGPCGVGSQAARKRLQVMAESDPAWREDPTTGKRVHYVRDTAEEALAHLDREEPVDPAELAQGLAVVAVKDFLRLENTGPAVEALEFPRYVPVIDAEQVVLARWASARTDDGEPVSIEVAEVAPDPAGNLIHTWRLDRMPAKTGVVVTVTTLVLRRERPPPTGRFPIPDPAAYPEEVRPFLGSTPCVVVDHPAILAAAAAIRRKTDDAYAVAAAIAARMKDSSYTQKGRPAPGLPTSVAVLQHGGSCCGSAVCAAALLRACGVPAQITYVPAGYIHGIIRFYLDGYGWCRMDATSGVGRLPLVEKRPHRGMIRLYDMPIEMEQVPYSYAWPFQHNTVEGKYAFRSGGQLVPAVRFAARDEAEARREGRVSGRVTEPFPHLEPGSWHALLDVEVWRIADVRWARLVAASREATKQDGDGFFDLVVRLLRPHAKRSWLEDQVRKMEPYGALSSAE